MSDSLVTRCPHCQTAFRVNAAQLVAAGGAVRCGSCLKVFDGAAQLSGQPGEASPPLLQAEPALLPVEPPQPAQPVDEAAPEVTASAERIEPALDDDWVDHDPDLAELGLEDLDLDAEIAQLAGTPREPEPLPEPEPESESDTPAAAPSPAPPSRALQVRPARTEPVLAETLDDEPLPLTPSRRQEPALLVAPLADLEDEPLELDWRPPRKPWGRWALWALLNLLALGALAGQYLSYHFDELARQDRYRPWFEALCPSLGCELPSRVDIAQLRSSNLVVRSHPEFTGALAVDAIIFNRAPFAQPFPLLELRFADLSGKLIASRRFKPGEYLAGELAGRSEMPPQVPIHIALSILDPGPRAVNYSLSFQSPE